MREGMPLLLTESLDPERRELTHQHIENCGACAGEWRDVQETWRMLADLPDVEPPARARARFLETIHPAQPADNVVPFHRRPAFRWVAQAAAVAVLVGGGYFAGRDLPPRSQEFSSVTTNERPATVQSIEPAAYSLAETRSVPASSMSPRIEGRPQVRNLQFIDSDPTDDKIGLAFDVTSRVTVTGSPRDASVKRLLSYVIESDEAASRSGSDAIEVVRRTYSDPAYADPQIANALAKVLRNDDHEGARIRAVETLKTMPASASGQTQQALIEALKNDPNPSVRIKALEALAKLAQSGEVFDTATLDTLRDKSVQDDEVTYVRLKAAEALSNVKP